MINTCTIDYFLFCFWVTSKLNRGTVAALMQSEFSNLSTKLISIIQEIEKSDCNNAKRIFLREIAMQPILKNKINCFDSEYTYIKFLEKLQFYVLVFQCTESCNQNEKSFTSCSLYFDKQHGETQLNLFQRSCYVCKRQDLEFFHKFLYTPRWLFIDTMITSNFSVYDLPKTIAFGQSKYLLLCATFFKSGHFRGIFFINSKFYLVDDLHSKHVSSNIPMHTISWCFYYLTE